jgi:sec-independent protein translocase protein TatC
VTDEPVDERASGDRNFDDREYSLFEHLAELRKYLFRAAVGVFLCGFVCLGISQDILALLKAPLDKALTMVPGATAKFVVISPAENLIAQLKAAVVAGLFIASPWVLYQVWQFIAPGLYKKERRYVSLFVWAGSFFFCAGAVFAYMLVFPGMFKFFVENTMEAQVEMTISVAEHFSFALKLLIAFGVVFEAPVVVYVLSMAGIINPKTLGKYRAYVVVAGFVLGAILTPPDVISQVLLAMPLVLLFELGLQAAKIALWLRGRKEEPAAADD